MAEFKEKILRKLNRRVSWPAFWVVVSFLYALTFNLAEFVGLPAGNFSGFISLAGQWLIVACVSAGVIGLLAVSRIVFAALFPLLVLISSIEVYYFHTLGAGITGTTIEIALENDMTMWATVITLPLVLLVVISTGVAIVVAVWRWKSVRYGGRMSYAITAVCVVLIATPFVVNRLYAPVSSRIPLTVYSGFQQYFENRKEIAEVRRTYDSTIVEASDNSPDVTIIVGESLRPDHLGFNGYERNTTPLLGREQNLVSFTAMTSTGAHTFTSLPFIFTESDSTDVDWGYEQQSFITLFNKAGYKTAWFANQDIAKSYAYFSHEADTLVNVNSMRSAYNYDKWLDSDILPHYDRFLDSSDRRMLAVLHTIGSHWWYKSHYTEQDALFLPEMDSKQITSMSPRQIINSYDNTVVATDRFVHDIIKRNRDRNAVVVYVSDHGESLGENNLWLHASDTPELHQVAFFVWYSDDYARLHPDKVSALKAAASKPSSTDNTFNLIVDLADLRLETKTKN